MKYITYIKLFILYYIYYIWKKALFSFSWSETNNNIEDFMHHLPVQSVKYFT